MSEEEKSTAPNEGKDPVENVSERVLNAFVNKLASEDEYAAVAKRIKDVVFKGKVSEKSLRAALFGEEE